MNNLGLMILFAALLVKVPMTTKPTPRYFQIQALAYCPYAEEAAVAAIRHGHNVALKHYDRERMDILKRRMGMKTSPLVYEVKKDGPLFIGGTGQLLDYLARPERPKRVHFNRKVTYHIY